jgi:hypothetical protein
MVATYSNNSPKTEQGCTAWAGVVADAGRAVTVTDTDITDSVTNHNHTQHGEALGTIARTV